MIMYSIIIVRLYDNRSHIKVTKFSSQTKEIGWLTWEIIMSGKSTVDNAIRES